MAYPWFVHRLASHRLLLVLAGLLLAGFTSLTWLNDLHARELLDRQITASTLPLTSDAIRASLKQDLLQPGLVSGLMARIKFLLATLSQGGQQAEPLRPYLAGLQQKTGAVSAFWQGRTMVAPSNVQAFSSWFHYPIL